MSESAPSPLTIPELALVVLIGISGSGKSSFARQHFKPTEVLSSDTCRGMVSDDENNQEATTDAFEVLHAIAAKRLTRGLLTVVDATNVQLEARRPLIELARTYHCLPVAIVFDLPERLCEERNCLRPERSFGSHVLRRQHQQLQRSLRGLKREGFRHVFVLSSPDEVASATIVRQPLWNNRRHEHGPFDIIGDIHGCAGELVELLARLGYRPVDHVADGAGWDGPIYAHPEGRQAIFLGDLVDRGSRILDTLRLVRGMVQAGHALCVPGNHDMKLLRALRGRDVQVTYGLDRTLAELAALPDQIRASFSRELINFLDDLVSHYVFDDGRLVVAHAGLKESMQGRGSGAVRDFALYGETTGETDEFGLPGRYNWAADYRGRALVVYGHTPVAQPQWLNNTVNIDTGCIFGGHLSALRYPEREIVAVAAAQTYYELARPFLIAPQAAGEATPLSAQQQHDDLLDVDDVLGKRLITTRLRQTVTIREENASAALEVMSRFAIDPRWLIYLPPTMSPSETTAEPGLLEHPAEAFSYYQKQGISRVICEEKHMGSRTVVIVCRDVEAARRRFGVPYGDLGICYTRTGRRFFEHSMEIEVLVRLQQAVERAGWWDTFETDWICLDCELMPWSAKAQDLLRQQYAAVGAAAQASLPLAISTLQQAEARGMNVVAERQQMQERLIAAQEYVAAYRRYCWPVSSVADLKLAPFHLLATEGAVHTDKDHLWHMTVLSALCPSGDELLTSTAYLVVDVNDPESRASGIDWWTALTARGGEGMVVKPLEFIASGQRGLVQPAIKCRGREYLRIIYGPDYAAPANLERLRQRGLGAKRSLALREFALGIEALERFVRREPLRRVHECVFGILALESEPVDPRL